MAYLKPIPTDSRRRPLLFRLLNTPVTEQSVCRCCSVLRQAVMDIAQFSYASIGRHLLTVLVAQLGLFLLFLGDGHLGW